MTSDDVKRLATAVSLAARVEPELLRAARLRLFPDMDVSAEGDLWFSDLVASRSARRIVLDPETVSSLRQSYENNRTLLDAARVVVEETHRNAPPAIRLEEEIVYLALTGESVEETINTMLTAVLNAIANEGRRGLIDWAARALPGMPAIVQNTTAAAALRLVAGGQASDALHVTRDPAIAALVDRAVPKTTVFARLVPDHGGVSIEISRTVLPASHEIELPKTEPLALELTTLGHTEVVDVPREGTLLRETDGAVSIRTIARDVFRIEESREEERTTVRILVMTGLADAPVPGEPDIDLVLIAGDVAERGTKEEYVAVANELRVRFGEAPILGVPGPGDEAEAFIGFLAMVGFTTDRVDFAKTLNIGELRIGVVGIDTSLGDFEASQIFNACGGDPLAWARAHHAAILITYNAAEDLDEEARQRWEAFGTGDVFDFIVTGSANTPELSEGYVVVELPDPDGGALVSIHRHGDTQIRRQAIHPRMDAMPPAQPRRVLVAGIAEGLPVALQELCRAIGSLLALQGHDLLTGGWPGVDYLVAEGFDQAAPHRIESVAHYFGGLRKESDYKRGRSVFFEREEEALSEAVRNADVVILIEGAAGTRSVGMEAMSQGKPVIPIGGGAAAQLRELAIRPERWAEDTIERLRRLGGPAGIATIVHDVNELIRAAHPLGEVAQDRVTVRSAPNRWDYDLYVSYSSGDDTTKWVRSFVEMLRNRLQVVLGHEVSFFFDAQLRIGSSVSEELAGSLRASRVLLVILSRSYLASDWCRQELQEFLRHSPATTRNIFVVEADRVPREEWPPELRGIATYAMWDAGGTIPLRLDPTLGREIRERFNRGVSEIGYRIAERLKELEEGPRSSYKGAVWIASVTDDLVQQREDLAARVRQHGWDVLPVAEYPSHDAAEFTAALEKDLGEAQLLIQLLGPRSGRNPDWSRLSFPELQANAARTSAERRGVRLLRWRARGTWASEDSDTYGVLVREGDVYESTFGDFAAEVSRALNALAEPVRRPSVIEESVALICGTVDKTAAIRISEMLIERGIQTWLYDRDSPEERSPIPSREMLRDMLQTVRGVLLIYGPAASSNWIQAQFVQIRKELARRSDRVPIAIVTLPPLDPSYLPIASRDLMVIDFGKPERDPLGQIVRMITSAGPQFP